MNRKLLALFFILLGHLSFAQVASIRPNNGFRGQSLTSTITSNWGVISNGSGPYGYQDIYLQQGANIIYCDPSFDPAVNIYMYNSWPYNLPTDSLYCLFNIPSNAASGFYDVHVLTYQPWSGLSIDNILTNGFLIQGFNAGSVSGNVYFDANQNGSKDVGEPGMANHRVQLSPLGIIGFTDSAGNYQIDVDTGTYTLTYQPSSGFAQTSLPNTYSASVPPNSTGNDFGTYSFASLYGHTLSVWNHPLRCLTHGYTYFSTVNNGTMPSQGSVSIVHSSNLPFVSSIPMPDIISGDTLIWNYSTLQTNQSFGVGNTSSTNWIVFQDPAAGQSVWYTVTDSVKDVSGNFVVAYSVPWSFIISCSCDPNEKDVAPVGIGAPHYTGMNEYLNYTINFQNTGTDTAFNVTIYDTLDADLDLNTLEILGSSDPLHVQMGMNGETQFIFSNILLPDSNIDEPGSHGFVNYRIRGLASLPDPTPITNTAHIVFDLNDPIVTNTSLNTLTNLQYPVASLNSNVNSVCANSCINYSATTQSGTTYQWIFQGGSPATSNLPNPSVCYFNDGSFDVTLIATNALGSDTLVQPNYASVNPSPNVQVNQIGDSLIATAGFASYQWYYLSTPIGSSTSSILATQDGDYTLLVTNSFGCQSSVSLLNVVTGISDVFADGSTVSVFPNPSNGSFRVQYLSKTNSVVDVQLLNSVGQLVYSDQFNPVSEKSTLDINGISAGVYSLKLSTQNGSVIRKVLVQ